MNQSQYDQIMEILNDYGKRIEKLEARKSRSATRKMTKENYLKDLVAFRKTVSPEFLAEMEALHPDLDIRLSFRKIFDYWRTDEGYKKKMKTGMASIDWKATFRNGLNQEWNQVRKTRAAAVPEYTPPEPQDVASPEERREALSLIKKTAGGFDMQNFIEDNKKLKKELSDGMGNGKV